MGVTFEVAIPPEKIALVASLECARWLVDNTKGEANWHVDGEGHLFVRFSDPDQAATFRSKWLQR